MSAGFDLFSFPGLIGHPKVDDCLNSQPFETGDAGSIGLSSAKHCVADFAEIGNALLSWKPSRADIGNIIGREKKDREQQKAGKFDKVFRHFAPLFTPVCHGIQPTFGRLQITVSGRSFGCFVISSARKLILLGGKPLSTSISIHFTATACEVVLSFMSTTHKSV